MNEENKSSFFSIYFQISRKVGENFKDEPVLLVRLITP